MTIELEEGDGKSIADKLGLGEFRNRLAQFSDEFGGDEEVLRKAPERMEAKFKRMA